jgi:signal transduction histidine kinase
VAYRGSNAQRVHFINLPEKRPGRWGLGITQAVMKRCQWVEPVFAEKRDLQAEELEIARALATQASLAIQLTQLAKTAKRSAVLEERNQLAGEIHDSLAQFFTGISMQLGAAKEVFKAGSGNILSYLEWASDLAQFGLSEARRSAFSLQPTIIEESGLAAVPTDLKERRLSWWAALSGLTNNVLSLFVSS